MPVSNKVQEPLGILQVEPLQAPTVPSPDSKLAILDGGLEKFKKQNAKMHQQREVLQRAEALQTEIALQREEAMQRTKAEQETLERIREQGKILEMYKEKEMLAAQQRKGHDLRRPR